MQPRPLRPDRPAAIRPVVRRTLASATLDAIRERILVGVYAEGAQLRQDALAAELGVSRIPVREALRQLEAEGLVTFKPHRGAVVSSLSIGEIEELFELRAALERELIRRAVPRLTEEQLRRAEEILDVYEAALVRGDVAEWGELNWALHATLLLPAERPVTMDVVARLHRHAERYMRMQLALTHGETRANDEHRAIVRAARMRDAEHAADLLEAHILEAGRVLVELLRGRKEP